MGGGVEIVIVIKGTSEIVSCCCVGRVRPSVRPASVLHNLNLSPHTDQSVLVEHENARGLIEGARSEAPATAAPGHRMHLGPVSGELAAARVGPKQLLHGQHVRGKRHSNRARSNGAPHTKQSFPSGGQRSCFRDSFQESLLLRRAHFLSCLIAPLAGEGGERHNRKQCTKIKKTNS